MMTATSTSSTAFSARQMLGGLAVLLVLLQQTNPTRADLLEDYDAQIEELFDSVESGADDMISTFDQVPSAVREMMSELKSNYNKMVRSNVARLCGGHHHDDHDNNDKAHAEELRILRAKLKEADIRLVQETQKLVQEKNQLQDLLSSYERRNAQQTGDSRQKSELYAQLETCSQQLRAAEEAQRHAVLEAVAEERVKTIDWENQLRTQMDEEMVQLEASLKALHRKELTESQNKREAHHRKKIDELEELLKQQKQQCSSSDTPSLFSSYVALMSGSAYFILCLVSILVISITLCCGCGCSVLRTLAHKRSHNNNELQQQQPPPPPPHQEQPLAPPPQSPQPPKSPESPDSPQPPAATAVPATASFSSNPVFVRNDDHTPPIHNSCAAATAPDFSDEYVHVEEEKSTASAAFHHAQAVVHELLSNVATDPSQASQSARAVARLARDDPALAIAVVDAYGVELAAALVVLGRRGDEEGKGNAELAIVALSEGGAGDAFRRMVADEEKKK